MMSPEQSSKEVRDDFDQRSGFEGLIRVERENKEKKLVLVMKVKPFEFCCIRKQTRQSWVAGWSQVSFGVFRWEILQHIYMLATIIQ